MLNYYYDFYYAQRNWFFEAKLNCKQTINTKVSIHTQSVQVSHFLNNKDRTSEQSLAVTYIVLYVDQFYSHTLLYCTPYYHITKLFNDHMLFVCLLYIDSQVSFSFYMSIKTGLFFCFLLYHYSDFSYYRPLLYMRTIQHKNHENFKNSKSRVDIFWFIKKQRTVCLKKLLVKTIIVFTSIYFESYCKIPARSNKSILQSFSHKIYLHVKGVLNQNEQI